MERRSWKPGSRGGPLAIAAVVVALTPHQALAIPVFARVYDKPCGACHTVYPQLNPEGERFRDRGLHGFPPAVQPLSIAGSLEVPGTIPLAVSLAAGEDISKSYTPGRNDRTQDHLNLGIVSILAGGELGPHLAFLADYALFRTDPRTGDSEIGTRPGLAFMQAHAELGGWLTNLRGGAFELPLGTSPRVHRLSAQRYLVYGTSAFSLLGVPVPTRGRRKDTLSLASTQIGGELSGVHPESETSWAVGVVTGSNNRKDNNSSKDVYLRLGRGFGFHRAGVFAYYSPDILGMGVADGAFRFGPDATLYSRRFRLVGQALAGYDANPTGLREELWYWGGFVEGNVRFTPELLGLLRVDLVRTPDFDDRTHGGKTHVRRRIWEVTGGVQWLVEENLKLVAEATYVENHEAVRDVTVEGWSVTVRVVTAFWPFTPPVIGRWFDSGSGS